MGYVVTVLFSDLHGEIDARQNDSKNTYQSRNIENYDHGKEIFEGKFLKVQRFVKSFPTTDIQKSLLKSSRKNGILASRARELL
jgi:iron uptake system EfeUOB component EfeO/EfeM